MTVRRGLSRDRLALIRQYSTGRCIYCGAPIRADRLVCGSHASLPTVDPHFAQR